MDMKLLFSLKTENVISSNTICTSIINNMNDFRKKVRVWSFVYRRIYNFIAFTRRSYISRRKKMLKYSKLAIVTALSMTLLAGCFGPKPEEELYVAFENAAKQEKQCLKMQKLETLEKEGQELYNQIVQEGKDNNQTVKEKLNQAVKNTDEREKVLKKKKNL